MLTILLTVLRILGITLLVLIGTILVLLLLILFFPITYRVNGKREPNGTDENGQTRWLMEGFARFRWLFGVVNGGYTYPKPGVFRIRVLWFTVFTLGGESKRKEKKPRKEKKEADEEADEEQAQTEEESEPKQEPKENPDQAQTEKTPKPETDHEPEAESEEQPSSDADADTESPKGIFGIIAKIKYTFSDICVKIKQIRMNADYYHRILTAESTKGLVRHVWMRLVKLLRAIRPRHVRADIRFGTGSPDTTGYALAVYGVVYPKVGWAVNLTPDFEEKVMEGRAKFSGHIFLGVILWHLARAALDPRLRRLIRQLKKDPLQVKQESHNRKGQQNGIEQ